MRKFVFILMIFFGFAVCYAAPPPDLNDQTRQVFTHEKSDFLPAVTPSTALQDQQPAPLLSNIPVYIMHARNIFLAEQGNCTGIPFNIISSNFTECNILQEPQKFINTRITVKAHSSGGMPY